MRQKYIELIKEYAKVKPGFESSLDEIKINVLQVGATEEEFIEALKQIEIEKIPQTPRKDYKKIFLDVSEGIGNKTLTIVSFAKESLIINKKYVAGLAVIVIAALFITQSQKATIQKTKIPSKVSIPKITLNKTSSVPIVYANLKPVDPEKIFSIKNKDDVVLTVTGRPKKEVMGFFPYWMLPKQDKVNLATLTSISLFGLDVDKQGNIVKSETTESSGGWNMWTDPRLNELLKNARNKNIKVYLTLKSFNSDIIESLSTSDEAQKSLIANAVYLVNSKNLDGINVDFEYIGTPSDEVRGGFTRLITNLNTELKRQLPNSILTVDTYLVSGSEKGLFNISLLAPNIDAFVIMGYDMHTPLGDPGPVSAMGGATNIIGYVQNYLERIDASKLILAVPYYGYDWPSDANLGRDAVRILPYAEIAHESQNLQLSWDETSETPYFNYKDENGTNRVVHFDNVRSLGIKYDFINNKNLRGVGIWALGYDGQNQDLEKLLIDKFINN